MGLRGSKATMHTPCTGENSATCTQHRNQSVLHQFSGSPSATVHSRWTKFLSLWRLFNGEAEVHVSPKGSPPTTKNYYPCFADSKWSREDGGTWRHKKPLIKKNKKISKDLWMEAHRRTQRFLNTSVLFTLHWTTLTVNQKWTIQVPKQLDH